MSFGPHRPMWDTPQWVNKQLTNLIPYKCYIHWKCIHETFFASIFGPIDKKSSRARASQPVTRVKFVRAGRFTVVWTIPDSLSKRERNCFHFRVELMSEGERVVSKLRRRGGQREERKSSREGWFLRRATTSARAIWADKKKGCSARMVQLQQREQRTDFELMAALSCE